MGSTKPGVLKLNFIESNEEMEHLVLRRGNMLCASLSRSPLTNTNVGRNPLITIPLITT